MDYQDAQTIYHQITSQLTPSDADLLELYNDFIRYGIAYARARTDWQLMDRQGRQEVDARRTSQHNAFIASCEALARYMERIGADASWRGMMGTDRKDIGDFACYLHCMLGIEAR